MTTFRVYQLLLGVVLAFQIGMDASMAGVADEASEESPMHSSWTDFISKNKDNIANASDVEGRPPLEVRGLEWRGRRGV